MQTRYAKPSTFLFLSLIVAVFMSAMRSAVAGDRLQLSLALRAEYTDNRDSVDDDDPAVSKESNWDYVIAPSLVFMHNIQQTFFRIGYDPSFRYRSSPRDDQNDNKLHHDLRLRIDHEGGQRFSLRVENRFSYSDDPEVTVGEEILRTDRSFYYNRSSGGVNYSLTRRNSLDIEGGYDIKRYDHTESAETSDEDRIRGQIRVQRQQTPRLGISALVSAFRIEREGFLDLNRDFETYFAGVGMRNTLQQRWILDTDAGYQWIAYDDAEINNESAPFVQGRLTYRPSSLTHFYAGGSYTLTEAYNFPFVAQEKRSVYSGFSRELTKGIRVGAEGEYRIEQYKGKRTDPDTPAAAYQQDREGDTTRMLLSGWIDVPVWDGVSAKLRHYLEDVDSDVSASFTRNMTRAELRFLF